MILWTGRPTAETEPAWEGAPLRAWRWVFEVKPWSLGFVEQYRQDDGEFGRRMVRYGIVYVSGSFRFGMDHDYYDGPHCQFSIGWLHVAWAPDWCRKCMPDDPSEAA
jgi:hypothetical protein